ncbi:MAG: hypothetical protein HFI33_12920 [Lachnospiraceae bacterium]|nr:hypothetical protein [Lachnospiraceae bacterium]
MEETGRIRRVGTVTLGGMLIFFGILFLVHMFVPSLKYVWIFRLWPVIFISLGTEVLLVGRGKGRERQVYDGFAMFLLALMLLFAMGMATADMCIQYGELCSWYF